MQDILHIKSLSEIELTATALLKSFGDKKIVAFYGEMGAGKTTLIKSICKVLGVTETVTSPTYSLVNEYLTDENGKIYHFDFYRIQSIDEAYDIGYEEYFESNHLCLIEWPERVEELLPDDVLRLIITRTEDEVRTIKVEG